MSINAENWLEYKILLKDRLKNHALEVIKFVRLLDNTPESWILGKLLLKSGTSCYANYRAALRGRSKAEFFSKIFIVVEEIDETEMWLDLMINSSTNNKKEIIALHNESLELLKILSHLRKTLNQTN
jgi:four helix bundle protein